jgi:diadenosine tetraphosphate (Ap4A) HIT family hydrolase
MNDAPNETLRKFGYPATVVAEYERWVVLLRPKQVTLGSLVLACREGATAFADVSPAAFADLGPVVGDVEANLRREIAFDKINYLMLMMVDPNVHFHVIPRYDGARTINGIELVDGAWPGPPDLKAAADLSPADIEALTAYLRERWTKG